MSKLKVNELDTESGTTVTVTTGKTLDIPAGGTLTVAGTQTVTGTANLTGATLTLPATLPATAATNLTNIPGANITGTIPLAALGNAPETDLGPTEDDIAVLGFQVAAASDLAKYSLRDQIVDTFQDASGIDASASANEIRDTTGKFWYGGVAVTGVTGGTITTHGSYIVHSFLFNTSSTTDQAFTTSSTAFTGSVLMVAGGGGGGTNYGAGGGGGGMRIIPSVSFAASTTYNFRIGDGGTGNNWPAGNGANSTLIGGAVSESATGGGGGGSNAPAPAYNGQDGGSGGGMKHGNPPYSAGTGIDDGGTFGTATYQGHAGGNNTYTGGGGENVSGGGGAGAVGGGDGGVLEVGGAGGVGRVNDYRTGSDVYYAGGGGGGGAANNGAGGNGGGGPGNVAGTDGLGGGGGGGNSYPGGSGIGVVRFLSSASGSNMTLVSTSTTAQAGTTDTGDVVMLYTPSTGTTTLNTDLKAYVSRDDGTTYTQATLVGKGSYSGTTQIASAHDLDISAQPAGTTMRWKVETLNQSNGVKETRINGMSLGWS